MNQVSPDAPAAPKTYRKAAAEHQTPLADDGIRAEFGNNASGEEWLRRWHERLAREAKEPAAPAAAMRRENPAVIPRSHCVEAVLEAAVSCDLDPLEDLLQILASPWEDHPATLPYRCPLEPHEVVHQIFCRT